MTNTNKASRKVYICQNKSDKIRKESTSGGVFSAISQYVLDCDGVVFGAEFNDEYKVVHGFCEEKDELKRFRGSKYVQSHLGDSFKTVKEFLNEDRLVLFSGTPCQIEGLIAFLGKKYDNLILMDVVCYSISSPAIWKQYITHLESTKKIVLRDVKNIKFRDKKKYGYEYSLMTFYDKNGNVLYSSGPESNQLLRSYVSNTSTRPSCYNCRCKVINRNSDFTVWDCYNIYQYDKKFDDNLGTSHLMVHSQRGFELLGKLDDYLLLKEVNMENAIESEPALVKSAKPSDMRGSFFDYYKSGNDVFNKFFQDGLRIKIERVLRQMLSEIGLYVKFKRLIKNHRE